MYPMPKTTLVRVLEVRPEPLGERTSWFIVTRPREWLVLGLVLTLGTEVGLGAILPSYFQHLHWSTLTGFRGDGVTRSHLPALASHPAGPHLHWPGPWGRDPPRVLTCWWSIGCRCPRGSAPRIAWPAQGWAVYRCSALPGGRRSCIASRTRCAS